MEAKDGRRISEGSARLYNQLVRISGCPYPLLQLATEMTSERLLARLSQVHPFGHPLWEFLTPHMGLLVGLSAIFLAIQYARSPWRSVPPGPRGLPILGNALQLRDKTWLFRRDCKDAFSTF
jgi:hypothetical protein